MEKRGKDLYKTKNVENGVIWDRLVEERPPKPYSYATRKEKFDYCIKQSFLSGENYLPGINLPSNSESYFGYYLKRYERFYDRYLSENLRVENLLSSEIKKQYGEGKGGEFKSGKFYSVASSSRFAVSCFSEKSKQGIIEIIKKIPLNGIITDVNITLEEGLAIDGMPNNTYPPQMDVIINTDIGDTYFVEVKCHEIFDTSEHRNIKLKWKYLEAEPFKKFPFALDKVSKKIVKSDEFISIDDNFLKAEDFGCNLSTTHFDFKQFLCHLMGIISYKNIHKKENIHFYYLFYKNEACEIMGNDKIYAELEEEISEIFEKFEVSFPEIDFGYCYNDKFDTLKSLETQTT